MAVARVAGQVVFPARFLLVGTVKLCPCGARGDPAAECSCSPQRLAAYREKCELQRPSLVTFRGEIMFLRPTNAGATWLAPRDILALNRNEFTIGNQIGVQPNGTLIRRPA